MPADPLAPPRPELIALLDAVKDNPDDDTPRLVLADWLDEQDDPLDAERAQFIRDDVARVRADGDPPPAAEREKVLRRWLGPVAALFRFWRFERGLPVLFVSGPRLLKPDAPALLASEPFAFVQFVHLDNAGGPRMEQMAAMPEFRSVPGLQVNPLGAFGVHYATRFFASPNLTGLRQATFRSIDPGAAGMRVLASNPALARLRKLSLVHNKLVDAGIVALAESPHLANLTHLELSDNNIGDKGAEALVTSAAFPNLRELDLCENPRLTDSGKQRLRDTFGDRVRLD